MNRHLLCAAYIAIALFSSFSHSGYAAPVGEADAKIAAQAWIDGEYSMQRLTARTVEKVETARQSGVDVHVAQLNGGGIVILPTDDRIDPVIAFSPSATSVTPDEKSPLWALLSRDLAARMAAATNAPVRRLMKASAGSATQTASQRKWAKLLGKSGGLRLMTASASPKTTISDIRVAPLVQSRWGQGKNSMYDNRGDPCFNCYTPGNSVCGCVATAMAQLMRYHEYPKSVTPVTRRCAYNGVEADYTMMGGAYDYANMPLKPEAEPSVSWYDGGATEAQRQAIGKLTYDCGVSAQMSWSLEASSAGGMAVHTPLKEIFGYASAHTTVKGQGVSADYRDRILQTNLDAGYPVLLSINGAYGGHEVVADGYGFSDSVAYTHLNMGWADECDVWYALPNIATDSYAASVVNGIVYNVFPTEAGEIVSGRVLDGSGNPIAGASVSIKEQGAASALKTTTSGEYGSFGFVVPAERNYIVMASFGPGSASTSARTGTSEDSDAWLYVGGGSYSLSSSDPECGNVSCGDLMLSSVATVAEPRIEPFGGLFYPTTNVTISCATAGATIRYTLDGSDPTASSAVYSAPFAIEDDTTVKARAFKDGYNASVIVTATFTYDLAAGGPKGDFYSKPIKISGMSGSYVIEDNSAYTLEEDEALHTLEGLSYWPQSRTCWLIWTAPGSGIMTFSAGCKTSTAYLPTGLAVYSNADTVPTSNSTRLALGDDFQNHSDWSTTLSLSVTQGTTYRIVGMPLYFDEGGTFTLTWSGDLTVAPEATQGTEVPVPHSWIAAYYPSADASAYETLASGLGANGLTVWESYLAGLDPTNANSKLVVTIRMDGTTPVVEWNVTNDAVKSLGYDYKVYGNATLDVNGWTTPTDSTHRFYKVKIVK